VSAFKDKYRDEEPRYLCYCGTKEYRKGVGDGTGTVEKWYRDSTVVPRNTTRYYRDTGYALCNFNVVQNSPDRQSQTIATTNKKVQQS